MTGIPGNSKISSDSSVQNRLNKYNEKRGNCKKPKELWIENKSSGQTDNQSNTDKNSNRFIQDAPASHSSSNYYDKWYRFDRLICIIIILLLEIMFICVYAAHGIYSIVTWGAAIILMLFTTISFSTVWTMGGVEKVPCIFLLEFLFLLAGFCVDKFGVYITEIIQVIQKIF